MNIETDRKYKVIIGRHEYFGTPKSILLEMSWWDRSRPDGDPGRVSNNAEYIQLVLNRLFVEGSEMTDINDEWKNWIKSSIELAKKEEHESLTESLIWCISRKINDYPEFFEYCKEYAANSKKVKVALRKACGFDLSK